MHDARHHAIHVQCGRQITFNQLIFYLILYHYNAKSQNKITLINGHSHGKSRLQTNETPSTHPDSWKVYLQRAA